MWLHTRAARRVFRLGVFIVFVATPVSGASLSRAISPYDFGLVLAVSALNAQPNWAVPTANVGPLVLASRSVAGPSEATPPQRSRPAALPLAGDHATGRLIEVGGRSDLGYAYSERFGRPEAFDDPAIEGGSRLSLDPEAGGLLIEGPESGRQRVTLSYHFASPFPMKELVSDLEGEIQGCDADAVRLMLSPDGREYGFAPQALGRPAGHAFHLTTVGSHRFEDSTGFWVRIAADLGPRSRVIVRGFRTACRIKPPWRAQVTLEPRPDGLATYRETFQSTRLLHLAEIENGRALEWDAGRAFIRGDQHRPVRVTIRQRYLTSVPLRAVVVRVRNGADRAEGGGMNAIGLSLDGQNLITRQATPASEGRFEGETEVRLDDPARLADARQFFLHIELSNRGGAPAVPSNWLSGIEVVARTAGPDATARLSALSPPLALR